MRNFARYLRCAAAAGVLALALPGAARAGEIPYGVMAQGHIPNGVTAAGDIPNNTRAASEIPFDATAGAAINSGAVTPGDMPNGGQPHVARAAGGALGLLRTVLSFF